jgi:Flp pilus assembly protein TadD
MQAWAITTLALTIGAVLGGCASRSQPLAAPAGEPDAKAHMSLGSALYNDGDLDGAVREYQQAITLDPRNAWAHNNLGATLEKKGDLDGAIREYQQAVSLDPENAAARRNLDEALRTNAGPGTAQGSPQR